MSQTASIIIVDYDPHWPALFAQEKARILAALGDRALAVEHIGSTAVAGLAAKPIIDIIVGVPSLQIGRTCVSPLQAVGYQYVPEFEVEMPERLYFRKRPHGQERTHQIHMVELDGEFWERHILFRDYLRTHAPTARQYERLKRQLAARYAADRIAYTDAKTEFIQSIEAAARAARDTKVM